ncbi:hypothetical protein Leryth_015781 [Lithospermum erythrorhizon]|nr:hypothetical protein Leryth_015781 [Lithospermum erythrorhizon]
MLLALGTAANDDYHRLPSPVTPTAIKGENSSGRKRFRTKFTPYQKEKMLCFAEKMNWKMPKSDESAGVEEFCNEVGVTRGVLKVWIHNNKHTIGKKDANNTSLTINNGVKNVGNINFQSNNGYNDVDKNGENSNNGGVNLHVSGNGSSPSSS